MTGHAGRPDSAGATSWPWVVSQRWRDVMFAHWPVDPAALRGLVPAELELDLYAGTAWISLVAMRMVDLHIRDLPPLPGTSEFPELNLRSYVRHRGRSGVYFFSIDAPGRLIDFVARHLFHYPYVRGELKLELGGDGVTFHSRRLDGTGAEFAAHYAARGERHVAAPGSLASFLSERYSGFAVQHGGKVLRCDLRHPPWQLSEAELAIARNTVFQVLGLDLPAKPFAAHCGETDAVGWLPVVDASSEPPAPRPPPVAIDAAAARALADDAARRVDAADDDEARYELRAAFYHGAEHDLARFGTSELAFLRWEIRRGVLAAPAASRAGSAWWRAVNRGLLVAGEEALARHRRNLAGGETIEVQRWLDALRAPSPARWYRAHNTSIVRGYLAHAGLARGESELEQRLMTTVLTRVLLAHAMVDPPARRGGRFEDEIARLIADPRSPAVDSIVHLADFYPSHYPLRAEDAALVLDRLHTPEGLLARLFDGAVRPLALYRHAAELLDIPELVELVGDDGPRYPR